MIFSNKKILSMVVVCLLALVAMFFIDPIPQDPNYHLFVDTNTFFGVNNFYNVISNIPFLIVGWLGMWGLMKKTIVSIDTDNSMAYMVFFAGVFLVGFGSSWYHYNPNTATLVWDRLPMTIAFMAFFCILWSEFIDSKSGKKLLIPLILLGVVSIFYWDYTESIEQGDLRWYAVVQFLPLVLTPFILVFFKSSWSHNSYFVWFLFFYILAKVTEYFDAEFFNFTVYLSGHSIKHLLAATGVFIFLSQLKKRTAKI
ncbi:MAG: ceramidase [Proteobacteria bacterium]|nr:ceramidase [Pseudomonadota bacterium]